MKQAFIFLGLFWVGSAIMLSPSQLASAFAETTKVSLSVLTKGMVFQRVAMVALGAATIAIGFLVDSNRSESQEQNPAPSTSAANLEKTPWGWLTAVIAVALILRLIQLNSDLWYDEVVTLVESVRLPFDQLLMTYTSPNNHILFTIFAKFCTNLFGESPWSMRLPALIAGMGSLAALYWVGLKITDSRITLLATSLVAVSYHHIWFSQNARGYTGMLLLTLIGTGLFLEGLRRREPKIWLAYALVLALAMYTHLSAVFAFMGHGIIFLAILFGYRVGRHHRFFRSLVRPFPAAVDFWPLIGFGFGLLIVMQFYAILAPQIVHEFASRAGPGSGHAKVAEWTNPIWTGLEIFKSLDLSQKSLVALLLCGILCIAGYLNLLLKKPVIAMLIVVNIPITLAALLLINFHIWPRYFFVNIGFIAIVIVNGAFVVGRYIEHHFPPIHRFRPNFPVVSYAITLFVILASICTLPKNYRTPKQDFTGARDYIESVRNAQDTVAAVGISAYPYQNLYAPSWHAVSTPMELETDQKKQPYTWLVYSFPTYMKGAHPEMLNYIANHYELKKEFPASLGDGTIYVWKTRK